MESLTGPLVNAVPLIGVVVIGIMLAAGAVLFIAKGRASKAGRKGQE